MPDDTFRVPGEWLPLAAQPITAVWIHPDYDDCVQHLLVARDWQQRGEDYLRIVGNIDAQARLVAVFTGHLSSTMGSAVMGYP